MSASVHEALCAEPTPRCAVDFLNSNGTTEVAYYCGQCSLIAARGSDGLIYTDEQECEILLVDAADRDLLDLTD